MRCRIRYKTGWTTFLFVFCIAGIVLTYRQLSDKQDLTKIPSNYVNREDGSNNAFLRDNVKNVHVAEFDQVIPQQGQSQGQDRRSGPNIKEIETSLLKDFLKQLYPDNWGTALDADEMAFGVKAKLSDLGHESKMSCKEIDTLKISQVVKLGSKKYVDRAYLKPQNKEVVIKSQGNDPQTKVKCMQKVYDADKCHVMGNYMLLRELMMLSILKHPGIIEVLGYCIRGDSINANIKKKGMLIVEEYGNPVNPAMFNFQPWEVRLKYAAQLAALLDYFEHSPLGSVGLISVRAPDFVTTSQGDLKLVDLDDMALEEKTCQSDTDCRILSASTYNIPCENGRCTNWNAKNNLQTVGPSLFHQLLNNPPMQDITTVTKFREDILRLTLTAKQIHTQLQTLLSGHQVQQHHPNQDPGVRQGPDRNAIPGVRGNGRFHVEGIQDSQQRDLHRQMEIKNNKILPLQHETLQMYEDYIRFNQSNFPGVFDYTCPSSRVVWGCVITVHSLREAAQICNNDIKCKSFVLFSSRPDEDALMTMVAKNSGNSKPQNNVGASLFVRKSEMKGGDVENVATSKPTQSQAEINNQCRIRTRSLTADARSSRERRLMTHLGLKGTSEDVWKVSMRSSYIAKCNGQDRLMASSTIGGRFEVEMSSLKDNMQRAVFLAEVGPNQFHISHLVVYHLDRILGLYHTPPTIMWPLRKSDLMKVAGDTGLSDHVKPLMTGNEDYMGILSTVVPLVAKPEPITLTRLTSSVKSVVQFSRTDKLQIEYIFQWFLTKTLYENDVHLGYKGVLTASMPKVAKLDRVKMVKLKHIVSEALPFSRVEKLNLEYVFLWYLTKTLYQDDLHFGYKGHLIHFGADQAFQDLNVNLIGYFYHCQFPNVVYKSLLCYKCTGHSSSICFLGQEVMQKLLSNGFSHRDINIRNQTPTELTTIINDAATSVLGVVDECIKTFGREIVLY